MNTLESDEYNFRIYDKKRIMNYSMPDYESISDSKVWNTEYIAQSDCFIYAHRSYSAASAAWLIINGIKFLVGHNGNSSANDHSTIIIPVSKGTKYKGEGGATGGEIFEIPLKGVNNDIF